MSAETIFEKANRVKSVSGLLKDPAFQNEVITLYNTVNSSTDGKNWYERECRYIEKAYRDDSELRQCTVVSYGLMLLSLAYNGVSLEPKSKAEAYIVARGHRLVPKKWEDEAKKKGKEIWEKRCVLMISGYGELKVRMNRGVIKHAGIPALVYEGDEFKIINDGGHKHVHHVQNMKSSVVTHAYIEITSMTGHVDVKPFTMEELMSYKNFSKDPTSPAWTKGVGGGPTRGMIEAKVIKHALSTYGKAAVGEYALLETEQIDGAEAEAVYAATMARVAGGGAPEPEYEEDEPVEPDVKPKETEPIPEPESNSIETIEAEEIEEDPQMDAGAGALPPLEF